MPFQATFLFTTLIISLHSLCSATENMPIIKGGRPNIVLFLADDQSYFDHAINGNQAVPTPVTEAFSKEALVFDRAYTGQAVCAPSRSMLTTDGERAALCAITLATGSAPSPLLEPRK